jgi:hypothetical protein
MYHPCGMKNGQCKVNIANLNNREGRSWNIRDPSQKTFEKVKMTKESDKKYCFTGSKSQKKCAQLSGTDFLQIEDSWKTGRLQPNGQLIWADGFTTEFYGNLCIDEWGIKEKARKERERREREEWEE